MHSGSPLENLDGKAAAGLGLRSEVVFPLLGGALCDGGAAVLNRGSSASRLLSVRARSIFFDFAPLRILPAF